MFSNGFRSLAAATGLVGTCALAGAEPDTPADGAAEAPKAGIYRTLVESSDSSRLHRLIDRRDIESMPALVDSLLDTIAKISSYRKPTVVPRVTKVSRVEIEHTMCNGPCPVKAWHMPDTGIFLDDSLSPETNLVHRSILLHELVHFLQEVNGEAGSLDECGRWLFREHEAYRLQNQYLGLIGNSESYRLMVANESWIGANRTSCEVWRRAINAAH